MPKEKTTTPLPTPDDSVKNPPVPLTPEAPDAADVLENEIAVKVAAGLTREQAIIVIEATAAEAAAANTSPQE